MSAKADQIKLLAERSGHHPDDVERDLPIIQRVLTDKKWAINQFYVLGDPWLWTPLVGFQEGIVNRLECGHPKVCEVLPRGHAKTTLITRSWASLNSGMGVEPFTVIYSLTEEGREGNLEAMEMVATDPDFEPLQWLFHYAHGPEIATRKDGRIHWGNGAITEFRSLLGESRGLNRPSAGGRPSLILLDDVIPSDAMDSETIRRKIVQRYLSMIRPMGRKGSRIVIVGTVMDIEDLIGMIITQRMKGFLVTPVQHRRAYDPQTRKVLFPEKHTYAELMQTFQNEYVSTGNVRLWKREQLNDPSGDETHPFTKYAHNLPVFRLSNMRHSMLMMDRTLGIDNAHGAGRDYFVCMEYWRGPDGRRFIPDAVISNTMDMATRLHTVLRFIMRRRPQRIVIEKTSESWDFIEALKKYLSDHGVHINIETPTAGGAQSRAKNNRIYGWNQPLLEEGYLHVPIYERPDHTQLPDLVTTSDYTQPQAYEQEGDTTYPDWVLHLFSEMSNFNMTRTNNVDDALDTMALCEEASQEPSTILPEVRTGNPIIDDVMNTLIEEQNEGRRGRQSGRSAPKLGGARGWR